MKTNNFITKEMVNELEHGQIKKLLVQFNQFIIFLLY